MFQTASLLIISARVSQNFFPRKRVKFPLFISSKGIFQTIDSSLVFYSTDHKTLKRLKHSALNINFTCNKQADISLQENHCEQLCLMKFRALAKKNKKIETISCVTMRYSFTRVFEDQSKNTPRVFTCAREASWDSSALQGGRRHAKNGF